MLPEVEIQKFEGKFEMVDKVERLREVREVLEKEKVIAIDLENHHVTSYHGYLCLIQITIPNYDTYLIDALALRDHIR